MSASSSSLRRTSGRVEYFAIYFFSVLGFFAVITFLLNFHSTSSTRPGEADVIDAYLKDSFKGSVDESVKTGKSAYSLAGLSCDRFAGGPSVEVAREMVYWKDIPQDSHHVSPLKKSNSMEYLTFEPDHGGFNNIRMAFETTVALAFSMGRTLVLPPEKPMYLLHKSEGKEGKKQRNEFSFNHFFHMEAIHDEHAGLDIITMQEFLDREAMTGHLVNPKTGQVVFPPGNRTNWKGDPDPIFKWLRNVARVVPWVPENCLAVFPARPDKESMEQLQQINATILSMNPPPKFESFVGKPVPVDAPPLDRMKENWAGRKELCVYDQALQAAPVLHFQSSHGDDSRLLVHFYAFLFYQDWRHDLWMKRFMRDHVRFIDEIQCAAARVVNAVRNRVRERTGDPKGIFDTMHVRRGDFQYKVTRVSAAEIYQQTKRILPENGTIFIATDERDKKFFRPLQEHYDILFLDDFIHEVLGDLNSNYYGMVDVLVATRGRYFFGCWFSTFTGYINRLRGYHASLDQYPGVNEQGTIPSWYYVREDHFDHMQTFYPVKQSFYAREFPTAWRNIDYEMHEFHQELQQQT